MPQVWGILPPVKYLIAGNEKFLLGSSAKAVSLVALWLLWHGIVAGGMGGRICALV